MSRFVIPDIHGHLITLRKLIEERLQPGSGDNLYFLGDYISRGPFSRQVIDYLIDLPTQGIKCHYLRGNHEEKLYRSIKNNMPFTDIALAESFQFIQPAEIPTKYVQFLENLVDYIELPDVWLVHAGFNFNAMLTDTHAMRWLRLFKKNNNVDPIQTKNKPIVVGHNTCTLELIQRAVANWEPIIPLDNGICHRNKTRLGYLCALNLDTRRLYIEKATEVLPNQIVC